MNRREFLAASAAAPLLGQTNRPAKPFVCIHQVSPNGFDYRTALEGYSKAGIRASKLSASYWNEPFI